MSTYNMFSWRKIRKTVAGYRFLSSRAVDKTTKIQHFSYFCTKTCWGYLLEVPHWDTNYEYLHVQDIITKTYLPVYNFDPLKPNFYTVKLGLTGVYINFLISAQKLRLWVLVRTASASWFLGVPTVYVLSRNMKTTRIFSSESFHFFGGKILNIFE